MKFTSAHDAWSRVSSEHRARHLKLARQNAPTNARQAANFVAMDEWHQRLKKLQQEGDCHSTLQGSMSIRTTARLFGDKSPSVSLLRHSYCTSLDYNTLTGAQRDVRKPGTVRKPKTNTAI